MKYAVVQNDFVTNVIVAEEAAKAELEEALCAELTDAAPFGLAIGDMRANGVWTRNMDGVETPLDENATYDELLLTISELEALLYDNEN